MTTAGGRGRGLILAYHRVAELPEEPGNMCLPPRSFRAQLELLVRDYFPMPLSRLAAAAAVGALPPGAVAITLDDGYLDALTEATPLLREVGAPATVFVTTECLDEKHELWPDLVRRALAGDGARRSPLVVGGRAFDLQAAGGREEVREALWEELIGGSLEVRRQVLAELADCLGPPPPPRESHRTLLADEVRQLAAVPGITIGCHTVHHLCLPLQPLEVQRREMATSREALEALLRRPVTELAYPYGWVSPATASAAREVGFHCAVTAQAGPVVGGADPFALPRCEVRAEEADRFADVLAAAFAAPGNGA